MDKSLATLGMLLEKQNNLVLELLRLGEEELLALKADNLDELQEITGKQQVLSERLAVLEKERIALQTELADRLKLTGQLTLKELMDAELPGSEQVAIMGNILKENFLKLKELNETNNLLIRQSLAYINKMLSAMMTKSQATYGQNGQVTTSAQPSLKLDKSV